MEYKELANEIKLQCDINHVTFLQSHTCSICHTAIGWHINNDDVTFNTNCACTMFKSAPHFGTYDDIAKFYINYTGVMPLDKLWQINLSTNDADSIQKTIDTVLCKNALDYLANNSNIANNALPVILANFAAQQYDIIKLLKSDEKSSI